MKLNTSHKWSNQRDSAHLNGMEFAYCKLDTLEIFQYSIEYKLYN